MQKLLEKPYLFFFGLVPVTLILSFLFRNKALNIAYYEGELSIKYKSIFLLMSVFFILLSLNYIALAWATKKPKKWGTIFHILLQFISLILFIVYAFKVNKSSSSYQTDILNIIMLLSVSLFILSIFIHFINFFVSLLMEQD